MDNDSNIQTWLSLHSFTFVIAVSFGFGLLLMNFLLSSTPSVCFDEKCPKNLTKKDQKKALYMYKNYTAVVKQRLLSET